MKCVFASCIAHVILNISSANVVKPQISNQTKCLNDILFILRNLDSPWAIRLLDSYGKLPSGVLLGDFMWIGKYYECLEILASSSGNETKSEFRGMYCLAEWKITLPHSINIPLQHLPLRTGVCLPDTCKGFNDKTNSLGVDYILAKTAMKQYVPYLQLTSLKCDFQNAEFGTGALFFLSVIGVYIFIVLLATIISVVVHLRNFISSRSEVQAFDIVSAYDEHISNFINQNPINSGENEECEDERSLFHHNFNGDIQRIKLPSTIQRISKTITKVFKCFCLFSNASKILDTKTSKNDFLCIHGIRVISMAWIILGHTYVHNMDIIGNYVELWKSIDNLPFQITVQGTFSVDSFFLIGGFLLSYLYLDESDRKQGKISLVKLWLHRFIRITPVYMILIAFKTLLFKHVSSGPFWSDDIGIGSCEKNWWWNILYINNFLPLNSMCISWSWYLANDMQFFILSSVVLYIFWRWHKIGLSIFLTMLISSWAITGYISYIYNVMPLFVNVSEAKNYAEYYQRMQLSWNLIYSKPYCRISSHVIGILLAFILYKRGNVKYVMSWWMQTFGWCIAVFCSTSVIYGLYHIKSNQVLFNVYNALARSCFCIGVSWVIYCCTSNQGGLVNRFLSSKLWIPLSRLTFCAYLSHPLIMSWYFQSQKVPFYFTHPNMVVCYLAFLVMSYGIAFVISVTFEAPLINLEKLITKRESR